MGSCRLVVSAIFALCLAYCIKFYAERDPNTETFLSKTTHASTAVVVRMFQAIGLQFVRTSPHCDFVKEDLRGQLILITGGNTGIGLETTKGLVKRGADVVMVGRNEHKIEKAVEAIKSSLVNEGVSYISLRYAVVDMSDLRSVAGLVPILDHFFSHRKFDQLILNAAIWPQEYAKSAQGYEIAFATNALGPHLLARALIDQDLLRDDAKVIYLTGDIYITVAGTEDETCTPDFRYSTPAGSAGQVAYSRSKLGLMWLFEHMHVRFPQLNMYLVHPGVVGTALAGGDQPPAKYIMLSEEEGAQTTLICATASLSMLESGAYYHNTLGKLMLPSADPAKNTEKAAAFVELAESLIAPFLVRPASAASEPVPPVVPAELDVEAGKADVQVEAAE